MKKLLISVALVALAGSALAQDAMKATRVKPDELTWKANPALPPGAQVAILVGDPTKAETTKSPRSEAKMVVGKLGLEAHH